MPTDIFNVWEEYCEHLGWKVLTAVATSTGDVFMWDAKKRKDETPLFTRVHGVKRATSICVGETHMLVLSSVYHPEYPPKPKIQATKSMSEWNSGMEELDEDILFNDVQPDNGLSGSSGEMSKGVPSLKSLCEKVAVEYLLEPKNAIQLLEVADSLEAKELKKHCEDLAIRNLDYIFTVGAPSIMNASPEILANLEKLLDEKSSESWSQRRLPTVTATYPAVIDSDVEEDEARKFLKPRKCGKSATRPSGMSNQENFLQKDCTAEQAVSKQIRALRKKLQQIEILEAKQLAGHQLDNQQQAKLESRAALENELAELGVPSEAYTRASSVCPAEGRTNRKPEFSKKQKKKNKQALQSNTHSAKSESGQQIPIKDLHEVLPTNVSAEKEACGADPIKHTEDAAFSNTKSIASPLEKKPSQSTSSKKKNRKGGLSLFLSGALDDTPKLSLPTAVVPVTPKQEGPAWGGAKITKGPASLRDIQSEQRSKMNELITTKARDRHEDSPDSAGPLRLFSFMPDVCSSPVSVVPAGAVSDHEGDKSTPPWSSSATSPNISRPSLRDIQTQQEKRHHGVVSQSPKTRTSGFAIPSQGTALEVGGVKDNVPNRWFKPETDTPSSIRSIQIEEQAMKDFKRFYTSVRIMKPQV